MNKPKNNDDRSFHWKNISTSVSSAERRDLECEYKAADVVPETGDDLVLTDGIYEVKITGILRV
jgi:hypothetical protein